MEEDRLGNRPGRQETIKTEPLVDFGPDEISTTMAEFLLSPNIPPSERQAFKKFAVMFNQVIGLTNIKRWERVEWSIAFKQIVLLQEIGDYETARALMGEYLMMAQLGRSIDGMNALYCVPGITRTTVENLEPPRPREDVRPARKGIVSRIVGGVRGR